MKRRLFELLRTTLFPVKNSGKIGLGDDILILANGENASISYLIEPYIASMGRPIRYLSIDEARPADALSIGGTVVIARYLPDRWVRPLREFSAAGGKVIYFMDDDLMDDKALAGLPAPYIRKIRTLATRQRNILESLCNEFWVTSMHLAEKYRDWMPKLLQARPARKFIEPRTTAITICYHGTASHQADLVWLAPVIESVQAKAADTHFEVFGDHKVNKMFRDFPRSSVLHPMSWPNYLAYTSSVQRDIALAPLLPEPFNAARGPTKFFDFARMGAVGIYTDVAPYRGFIQNGIDGILLPNDPEVWTHTILELAADVPRRARILKTARERAFSLACDATKVTKKG